MKRRVRIAKLVVVVVCVGLCIASASALMLTSLDGAFGAPADAHAALGAPDRGLAVVVFLAFSLVLIVISVGASVADRSGPRKTAAAATVREEPELRAAPVLIRR
jgi:hypothetical protein